MRKLLVSDFDRTLYVNGDISCENLAALEAWKQNGNIFAIATGREEKILRELLCRYQLTADYLICNNGARVVKWSGKTLFEQTIEDDTAWHIVKELWLEYQIPVDVTQRNGRFQVASERNGVSAIYNGICDFRTLKELEQGLNEVLQIHVRFQSWEETREAVSMVNLRYDKAEAFVNEQNMDIVHKGINKAKGIEILLKAIKWMGKVIVIGDSFNDLCMIERFGGYTLESAEEEVRKRASYICRDVAACIYRVSE
ncbi:HAD-IIB family hydrolase [Candidatus Merdisoma sp. JLR.KK006]|uniref:HAD-IIB family hydrolase n=1 Tax=Candidatus Merdisoma sp. JLR.KK006 TaxID=3112626 RepID=UPI002FF330AC